MSPSTNRLLTHAHRLVHAAAVALTMLAFDAGVASAQSNLVAAYAFNEGSGTTVADASGNGNSGTLANATWTTAGKYGNALTFNGTSALVTIPDAASLDLTTGMTLEAWVNPTAVTSNWRDVLYKGNDVYYLDAMSSNSLPAVGGTFGSTGSNLRGPSALTANVWVHLAATYDGATLRLYVNGTQVASKAQTGNLLTSTNPLQIGGDSLYGQFFQGQIDEVRVYKVALTATQIQTDMNTPIGGAAPTPDMTVTKAHSGAFTQGQTGATYTLTVRNGGAAASSGTVTLTDTLPASGLTATAMSGTGWTCTLATRTCTRSDALAAGATYPVVTLTVNVASNAPASVTNTATVSGGGQTNTSNDTASDPTAITAPGGLVAAYAFNEGSGTTVADASGNGNTGTITNATWTTAGKYGNALTFNGTNALVSIPDTASLHLTTGMTLEAWVNPTTVSVGWRDVIYKGNDNYYLEGTSSHSGVPAAGLTTPAAGNVYSPSTLTPSVWAHLAATYDGATLRLYVNGTQVATKAQTGNLTTSTNPLQFGGDSLQGQFFQGQIDEVRIYNVALTATQIQADMNTAIAGGGGGGDSEPPSAPGTLVATAVSGTQVNLSWGAAQDNVGVTGYRVERCQGAGCSSFVKLTVVTTLTFSDTGLTPNTAYSYIIRATDAAGNLGPYSNIASVTTLSTIPQLVAAYAFNEGVGTTVTDVSGNGNSGTLANATWTTAGKYGNALTFNGTSALVTIPDAASLDLTTGMTLEAWVKPTAVTSNWRDVLYKGNDVYYLDAMSSNTLPAVGGTFGSTGSNLRGPSALTANVWVHLAATYDGATLRFYVNGTQVASKAQTGNLLTSTNPLQIGGDSLYGQFFQGQIDEVRVYNVALTPTQIQTDMNTPLGANVPIVFLSTTSVGFGSQIVGTTSAPTSVTLQNVGGAALAISSITVTGANSSNFSQTNNCGSSVSAGLSCQINVSFTPTALGARSGAITIQDSASGSPHSVSLTGTGVDLLVTPATATLTPGQTQQFSASGGSGNYLWSVDGVAGGSSTLGTISTTGLYTAPGVSGTHTVTATTTDQQHTGNATVFIAAYLGTFTFHNDNLRTGRNLNETTLTLNNVNSGAFGKIRTFNLDGQSIASPLYVPNVAIPGQGTHNVVYVATEHNSVYAFDADGLSANPLWQASFINPAAGITSVPNQETGECCDIAPEIGITGTPAIDSATKTLYVVAKTKEVVGSTTNYVQKLHALDITTGAEKFGGPVVIQANVAGTGNGSQNGRLDFLPLRENQRTALLLSNGAVYIAWGSHGDVQPYHGWVMSYNATTLQQVFALCLTPNNEGAGIWQSGGGLAADAAGNVYFITSDGTLTANVGGSSYGDSFVKINPAGTVLDYFSPSDQGSLDSGNIDLGAGGPMLLPDQPGPNVHLMLNAGKNGDIYLVNRDNMGHFNSGSNQVVQSLQNIFPFGTPEPGNYSAPVYFNGYVYFSPVADNIQAFQLTNGLLSTSPTSRSSVIFAYPGGTVSISANGSTNGILWALRKNGSNPGTLHAYNAMNLGIELYNSDQAGSRDTLDNVAKYSAPLVANGKVFVASTSKLTVYGLLP